MEKPVWLDKFLADAGAGTRSEVKKYIQKGQVQVNGKPVKKPELKVTEEDQVVMNGQEIHAAPEYGPEATEPSDEETIREVIKTDYGYFFRLENNGHGFNPAYRLELSNPETLIAVDTADPYSMDGYSGTDSLVRNKDFN